MVERLPGCACPPILTLASLIKEQPEQSYIGIPTPKKHAGQDIYSEAKSAMRCEESNAMRVKRAIAMDRKTGSQFPTLKTANNRGLVEDNQSEEYPDAPQAERVG